LDLLGFDLGFVDDEFLAEVAGPSLAYAYLKPSFLQRPDDFEPSVERVIYG
jgi:hypothetical protein